MPPTLEGRSFVNNYGGGEITPLKPDECTTILQSYKRYIEENSESANCDESLYTGGPGVGYAFLHCFLGANRTALRDPNAIVGSADNSSSRLVHDDIPFAVANIFLKRGKHPWRDRTHRTRHPEILSSLLCGHAGVVLVEFLFVVSIKDYENIPRLVIEYCSIPFNRNDAYEWLYGLTGYLYGLLRILHELQILCEDNSKNSTNAQYGPQWEKLIQAELLANAIPQTINIIIRNGRVMAQKRRKDPPLMYQWCDEFYIGGAHGLAGIYYILLCAAERGLLYKHDLEDIQRGIDWLLRTQKQSNDNYPAVEGEGDAGVVHFCHGAPGFVYLYAKAHEVFYKDNPNTGESPYMKAVLDCGELIWKYGILKKGPGLCHGIAGNAYCFMTIFRLTNDKTWIIRAHGFARAIKDFQGKHPKPPDRPLSLFEGIAGTMCLFQDLQNPGRARFPLFEL